MSNLRKIGTRESAKGSSISTSQVLTEPLPNGVFFNSPDPRLTIGARIPIPFQEDSSISYTGESIFGRRKTKLLTMVPRPDCKEKHNFCHYCNVFISNVGKHVSTAKCQAAQERFLTLPQLTNTRAFRMNLITPMESDDEVPPPNFPPQAIEWVENLNLMSQLTRRGLLVDFGTSDFLLSNANIPIKLRECCFIQTRTGSFLEALLLSVSNYSPYSTVNVNHFFLLNTV